MLSAESRTAIPLDRGLLALLRVSLALMWIQNVFWKVPPDFGLARKADLYQYVNHAVEHPVLAPYAWIVEHVVLPNFVAFGWLTLLSEAGGAWVVETAAPVTGARAREIAAALEATPGIRYAVPDRPKRAHAASYHPNDTLYQQGYLWNLDDPVNGSYYGVDAVLRPIWSLRSDPVARLARVAS